MRDSFHRHHSLTRFLFPLLLVSGGLSIRAEATEPVPAATFSGKWTTLHTAKRGPNKSRPLREDSPLQPLDTLKLRGLPNADVNLIGHYSVDGTWGTQRGLVLQTSGSTAALKIANADDFELDAHLDAGGLGGWFLLVGWRDGHGYILYNVQLKKSTSPWLLCEIRGGEFIPETHRELTRYAWGGALKANLTVHGKQLTLRAGKKRIATDVDLPNYHEGDVIIGTYNSQYGPKPLRLGNLRIRKE